MIILRSLCLLHHASSPDNNITHVVMVDDDSAADFGSVAVRRPFRVGAMFCFDAIFGSAVDFGSAAVRQPFDGLPELMLCFASMPSSVRRPNSVQQLFNGLPEMMRASAQPPVLFLSLVSHTSSIDASLIFVLISLMAYYTSLAPSI